MSHEKSFIPSETLNYRILCNFDIFKKKKNIRIYDENIYNNFLKNIFQKSSRERWVWEIIYDALIIWHELEDVFFLITHLPHKPIKENNF